MSGTLYIASSHCFIEKVYISADKSSLKDDAAHILVYQSEAGRTGFYADPTGESLVYVLLTNAQILSPSGDVSTFSCRNDSFVLDVYPFLSKGGRSRVTFVGSDAELIMALKKFTDYATAVRLNRLRVRYGRLETDVTEPILFRLLDPTRKDRCRAIEALYEMCDYVTIWPIDNSGFGMYAILLSKDFNLCSSQLIEPWALDQHCKLARVSGIRELPVW